MTASEDRRKVACNMLGVKWEDVMREPQITPQLRMIHRAIRGNKLNGNDSRLPASPYYYLRASDHDDAKKILALYDDEDNGRCRRDLPIEAFCLAAQVSPWRVLEIITGVCVRLGAQASSMVAAVMHPRVVEKTIERALTDEGYDDRVILHKATGFLPTPKVSPTNIFVSAKAQAEANAASANANLPAPAPENTIRRLADRFHEVIKVPATPAALPEDVGLARIPEVMPKENLVAVPVQTEEEEDEDYES